MQALFWDGTFDKPGFQCRHDSNPRWRPYAKMCTPAPIVCLFFTTWAFLKNWGTSPGYSRLSWKILSHVTRLHQSRGSENIWWIIRAIIKNWIVGWYNWRVFIGLAIMVYESLYNNQINARAVTSQSAVGYCAVKPTEKSRVFRVII